MKRPPITLVKGSLAVFVLALAIVAAFYFRQEKQQGIQEKSYVDSVTNFVDVSKV